MAKEIDLEFEGDTLAGPLDPDAVAADEKMLGLKFDREWLDFLSRYNGGKPGKRRFDVGKNTKVIQRFLCIIKDYQTSPHGPYEVGVVWSRIEARLNDYLVPFASLFPGDYLCLDHQGGRKAKVVWWDHEESDDDAPVTHPVADSFNEFLTLLRRGKGDEK